MYLSADWSSNTNYNQATNENVKNQIVNALDSSLPAGVTVDHCYVDYLCQGNCYGGGNANKAGAVFTAELIYEGSQVDSNQIVAAAVSHNRIGNNGQVRSVSDDVYYNWPYVPIVISTAASTTSTATTTTTAAASTTTTAAASTTTTAGNICNAPTNQQCVNNDTTACWNQLAIQCGWDLFDLAICDYEDETQQCPDDSAACWNHLTQQCGW